MTNNQPKYAERNYASFYSQQSLTYLVHYFLFLVSNFEQHEGDACGCCSCNIMWETFVHKVVWNKRKQDTSLLSHKPSYIRQKPSTRIGPVCTLWKLFSLNRHKIMSTISSWSFVQDSWKHPFLNISHTNKKGRWVLPPSLRHVPPTTKSEQLSE